MSTTWTKRIKPLYYALWTSAVSPWLLSLPWQNTEQTGGTPWTKRTKP